MAVAVQFKKSKTIRPEDALQRDVIAFLEAALPKDSFFTFYPLGGGGSKHTGRNIQRGATPGFPDLLIFWNRRAFCIELKAQSGRVGDNQKVTFPKIQSAGIPVEVCRTIHSVQTRLLEFGIPLRAKLDGVGVAA